MLDERRVIGGWTKEERKYDGRKQIDCKIQNNN